jgi:hypothetical protein
MNRYRIGEAGFSIPFLLIFPVLIIAVVMLFFETLRWIGLGILILFALLTAFVTINTMLHKEEDIGPRKRPGGRRSPSDEPQEVIEGVGKPTAPAPRKSDVFTDGLDGNLTYVDCAIATDGGSPALVLADTRERTFSLVLDRALGTETRDRIRYQGKELLSFEEEITLLPKLKTLAGGDIEEEAVQDIVGTFIHVIESRS